MKITITKVRQIGNSKGILLPKYVLEQCGIKRDVQVIVKDNVIIISPVKEKPLKTWKQFKRVKKEKADFVVNKFDSTDWTWE